MVLKSRLVVTMAGVSRYLAGGRMAEWLRPADCEVLTIKLRGINYQAVHLVSTQKVHRLVVGVKITSRRYYGRRKPIFEGAGWPSG